MQNNCFFFTNLDLDGGYSYIFPAESHSSYGLGGHILSQSGSFFHGSVYHANHFVVPGSLVLHEAYSCISKFAGALLFWFSAGPNSNLPRRFSNDPHGSKPRNSQSCTYVKRTTIRNKLSGLQFGSTSKSETLTPMLLKVASSAMRCLWKEIEQFQSHPVLSLAAALVPPFDNLSSSVLAIPLENCDEQINRRMCRASYEDDCRRCGGLSLSSIDFIRDAVEPNTGISFPTVLRNASAEDDNSYLTTEVLVGTGSKHLRVIRVKSLKVYAFGLYVHPGSVCERLGPKYASVPTSELMNRSDFYEDLLREDIHMTVRLVVNCNGLKINTVKDAFEKSLRARLQKMNPDTDYQCLKAFGSYFTTDIPLPLGTTIHFRKTMYGELITEIGGKEIGAVYSKDLCRAFFDMYIGDVPVSVQAKREVAENVADLMRRC